jgi:ABC-type transport system substrate-binding protein
VGPLRLAAPVLVALLPALCGCGAPRPAAVVVEWVVGQAAPAFDPQGPPDPVRWALERLLSRGLVAEDSAGAVVPAAAEWMRVSADGLVYTFHLRPGLAFGNGRACRAEDFRRALEAGVNRLDHSTCAWLLSAVAGMDKVRPGRPLPTLGITTPDPRTLVLRLARPDTLLPRKLALPGVGVPWSAGREGVWRDGIGDYRVAGASPGRLTLARRVADSGLPDTIRVRFVSGGARARVLLRAGVPGIVWPLAPDLLDQPLPAGYHALVRAARPERRLLLILRADLPPTSRAPARHALGHGINRADLIAILRRSGQNRSGWLPGAGVFDFPTHDPGEVQAWLRRGKLGRSLHAVMAYSSDGVGARLARPMQGQWARAGLDVELRPMAQPQPVTAWLRRGGAQLILAETQPLLDDPACDLAELVEPRGRPPVGGLRTGWSTREFDRWISGSAREPLDARWAQQRLAEERIVLPLAALPWVWIERNGGGESFHPRFGPEIEAFRPPPGRRAN